MLRTLRYYWRVNLAVLLGAAVATAVLAGALLVGDSVRGSLRDLTLDRLGRIDHALVSPRFVREALAGDLAAASGFDARFEAAVPVIVLRGSALHGETGTRASKVGIHGVGEGFTAFWGAESSLDFTRRQGQVFPSVWINEALARELEAEPGDSLVLNFAQASDVPRDTLMGEKETSDVVGTSRFSVAGVLPDQGLGRFSLTPQQGNPFNAFVDLGQLQRALDRRGEVNALFVTARDVDGAGPGDLLAEAVAFADLGLDATVEDGFVSLESREFVLRPNVDAAVGEVAGEIGAPLVRVQSYLANRMEVADRLLPYSMVEALDPVPGFPWSSLARDDGTAIETIGDDEIVLGAWAADDLGARSGDRLTMEYFEVGPREELVARRQEFTVSGVVPMEGLAVDRTLTPDYPGIQEARDMSAWDPPFEVDLKLVREEDEAFWDRYGATPKAFVSEATGRRLWGTRFGSTTTARIGKAPGSDLAMTAEALLRGLLARLGPSAFHLEFQAVKRDGLAASQGATDFSMLFVSFSFFLIVSAALIVGLLFGLNVEQRAAQIGLLLAVGYPLRRVRRSLLAEGLLLAATGGLLGLVGGVGYAGLMMLGLRTLWHGAVSSSALYLHVGPASLAVGWVAAVAVVGFAIQRAVRRLNRVPPPRLLAGTVRLPRREGHGRALPALVWGSLLLALALVGWAFATRSQSSTGLAFGSGTLLLVSGLAFFALWCRGSRGRGLGGALIAMAARNAAWNPGRSVLSVALVACACFVIVLVAANRHEFGQELAERTSGAGGYALIAESDVPLHRDLRRRVDLLDLGFSTAEAETLGAATLMTFRLRPGDDVSCLNLYQPEEPRILGVPAEFVARGGFTFRQALWPEDDEARAAVEANPWTLLEREIEPGVVPMIGDYNSMMWILKLRPGQDLEIRNEYGEPLRLRLVGTVDRSIFQSELLISERAFLQNFPGRTGYSWFLAETGLERAGEIGALLETRLALYGFDATTTAEQLAQFQVVEHTYLSTFQALGGLGLLLGTVGLGVVMLRNVVERRGELATLRAFGFRRSTLGALVLAENAFLLVAGMTVGSVAALLAVSPRLAAIEVPWGGLAATLAAVLAVGMLSGAAAVAGALRTPLLPSLKAER